MKVTFNFPAFDKFRPAQVVWISGLVAFMLGFLLLHLETWKTLERKSNDAVMEWSWRWFGPVASPEVVFVGIDDRTRDPAWSPNADERGRGGWWTKSHYSIQLNLQANQFRPAVLAYDLFFQPAQSRAQVAELQKLMRKIHPPDLLESWTTLEKIESLGLSEFQNELFNAADRGLTVLMAYAPAGTDSAQRLLGQNKSQSEAFDRLSTQALPAGCIIGGESIPAHHAVHLPAQEILDTPTLLAPVDVPRDADGLVRCAPLVRVVVTPNGSRLYLPAFAFRALLAYWKINPAELKAWGQGSPALEVMPGRSLRLKTLNHELEVPIDDEGRMWLKPRARLADFTNASFVSVTDLGLRLVNASEIEARGSEEERQRLAQARELQAKLRGKIVIIAESGTGSMDVGNYAFETNVSNGLAHLLVLDNLLRGDTLREARKTEVAVLLAVICALISQAFVRLSPGRAGAVTLMLALLLVPLHAWSILSTGIFFPLLAPEMIALTLFGINFSHSYTQANAQRQQVRQFFSKMVSPRVLEHLELNPELASLGGVRREATMFFSDVAGFTSISEKLTPTELAALLNRYLTPMTEIILEEDGYLDKYSGDGIMAVWGVPTEDKAHAIKACRAALRQHAKIQELAREILAESGIEIGVRMGINSGVVSAGNMGSESKFQYTVMGDAVNLAARLEPTNKDYGTYIILGNHTRELAGEAILARVLDLLVVKGKTEPVRIYELLGMRQSGDDTPDWARAYEEGFEKMLKRDWDGARAAFERCKQLRGSDEAAETMLARVADFRNNPPLEDWNGAYVRKKKD